MAQEWYLLKKPYDQLSGYEDEAFDDFAQESFDEALDSRIAVDVEIYNYDLSECKKTRAVVEGNLQDTKLKALVRQILTPIGSIKAGMYVKYKGRFWIVVGLTDDNSMYEKSVMVLCNYKLTWLNKAGKVIQRWANITSASQYNNGEWSVYYYTVRSDQLMIIVPQDDECILLSSGVRFIIDKRCDVYEKNIGDNVLVNTDNPVVTYKLTRSDSVLYDYQDSGHYEFLAYQDEQRDKDGYYVIDGNGYWLCDNSIEISESNTAAIVSDSNNTIYCGIEPCTFTAKFFDIDGTEVFPEYNWNMSFDYIDKLDIEYVDRSIIIAVSDASLIGKTIILSISADGYDTVSVPIKISAFI